MNSAGPAPVDWTSLAWLFGTQMGCPCCGKLGATLLSLAYDCPDVLPTALREKHANAMLNSTDADILTEDFCRLQNYRFVRCMIALPLQGRTEQFLVGVWGTLSQTNFDAYADRFDTRTTDELPEMTSWLSNAIPPGTPLPVACIMQTRGNGLRPLLLSQDEGPLKLWQDHGISPDDLAMLLAAYGHSPQTSH